MIGIINPSRFLAGSRFGQVFFTIRETAKLLFKIAPGYLVAILIFNTLWGFSGLPALYLDKLILDRIVANVGNPLWRQALNTIALLFALRTLLELLRNVLSRVIGYLRTAASHMFSIGMDLLMANKVAELDIATLENIDFKNRFNKIEKESGRRSWALMMPLSNIPNYATGFLSSVALLILLSPFVAAAVFLVALPQFLIDSKYIKKEYALRTQLSPLWRLWGWLNWALLRNSNFLEFKILNLAPFLSNKLGEIQKDVYKQEMSLSKSREISHVLVYLPTAIIEIILYAWLVLLTLTAKITIGSLQMYIQAFRSAQQNLTGLVSSVLEIYENYLYVVDLIWFFNLQPVINQKDGGKALPVLDKEIRFEHVWFRYREDTPWILKDVNLKIKPGERLAIVGENGAGKSTLIKLLARFYDPQKGNIFVGEDNLKDISVTDWHRHLAILFQKFEVYPFTARESIGYGDVERVENLEEIKKAANKTGIDKFIESLPLKWENPLAVDFEKGIDLSIGQWQRVGISRMLFRQKSELLILDEPTSNVDPKAEEAIFKTLTKKAQDKILIFISQRFSTVRDADQILVIEQGKITEKGTHSQLMKFGGIYAELFNLQAKGYQ